MDAGELAQITLLSLRVSLTAVSLSTLVGVFLGSLIATSSSKYKNALVTLVNTFMGTPPVLLGLVLYLLLSRSGPLGFLGMLFTPEAMVLAQFLLTLPIITGLTISAVESLPSELREFVKSISPSRLHESVLLLNESRIGVFGAVLAALARAVSEVGAVIIVGGNIRYYTRVLTTAIVYYTNTGEFETSLWLGATLTAIYLAINVVLVYVRTRLGARSD
ncbi:ABC transporter permease [Thermofilum pendens]|uniref:Binding-protein-dependent transport systems inner membrane component n=1 Tax=Thermofilum pendens (strain DSM 2475 / Hrk 5) TaxID=368408 RepID=A1S159_THEPD|nr:ABC transporter permease [Thermofilum pendens]ABL79189.1 binding-protein-dependent transport systems inner membrane component [Thermofilum pendens Hrk 5]